LLKIKGARRRLPRVAGMDWLHLAKLLAIAVGAIAGGSLLVVGAMVWFLNHPKD